MNFDTYKALAAEKFNYADMCKGHPHIYCTGAYRYPEDRCKQCIKEYQGSDLHRDRLREMVCHD
jgi:hypothetical protein